MTFAEKVIAFYTRLNYAGPLPSGVSLMNPFLEHNEGMKIAREFYARFYEDNSPRIIILGINPGRFGAGSTGIPFTDTIRLNEKCGIPFDKFRTYEPSSSFVYEMIDTYGGVSEFYKRFFVSAVCPLGFTRFNDNGKAINYNYYDSPALLKMVYHFILDTLKEQIDLGIDTSVGFCLGTGKNAHFLRQINDKNHFFRRIVALEHPRYIMQYRVKAKDAFIMKYITAFCNL
jgi:hypothetical protein